MTTSRIRPKLHFHIINNGRKVGETWAVSADKAITNYWWKNYKLGNPYTYTEYKPSDFRAVLA